MKSSYIIVSIYFSLMSAQSLFAQNNDLETKAEKYIQHDGMKIPDSLGVKSITVDFFSPSPGSIQGVCEKFPLRRTRLPEELLKINGKLTLEVDVLAHSKVYRIDVKLPLELVVLKDTKVSEYKKILRKHKERKRELILAAIKSEKKKERFQTFDLSDDELLKNYETDSLINEIEKLDLNFRYEEVWNTEIEISKKWKPDHEELERIEIPFSSVIYPQDLEDNRVYKLEVAQDFPHSTRRVGMFYTVILLGQ